MKVTCVSLADLDPFTIHDGVDLMKVIADQLQWIGTWNVQLSKKPSSDGFGPGFRQERDALILTRSNTTITSINYKHKIRRAFAIAMGWWVYNADKKMQYGIRGE